MYQVLARKLRPQTFEEIVGQEPIVRTLRNAVQAGRVAHAYVFAGVRGVGKTTTARILAKCLNCEEGPTPQPCNTCQPCREITEGRALDVLELDAASRTSVDDIRELQQVVSYAPTRDRYKVLIIDEAHMLSKSAFNALLKTLEEPPPQVVFILATTEPQRIPATILSRCQVFEFRRVAPRRIAEYLREVCAREGLEVPPRVLDWITRAAEGSVRDALSVLERVVAFCGEKVSEEEARTVLGAVRTEALAALLEGMAKRDARVLLAQLDELVAEGQDLMHLWAELVAAVRDLLVRRAVADRPELVARADDEREALERAAQHLSQEDLLRVFQILADLEYPLKTSAQPRYLFEAALVRIAQLGVLEPIENLIAGAVPADPAPRRASQGSHRTEKKSPAPAKENSSGAPQDASPASTAGSFRQRLRDAVASTKPSLAAVLDTVARVECSAGRLVIELGPDQAALRTLLEASAAEQVLREAASRVAGEPVAVEILGRKPTGGGTLEAAPRGGRSRRRPIEAQASSPASQGSKELLERVRQEPAIRKLLAEFGAEVVEIQPLGLDPALTADAEGAEEGP